MVLLLSLMLMPLDAYEPFLSLSHTKLHVATLNARSISNKSAIICDHIIENKFDVLCISETWINDGEMTNSLLSFLLPSNCCLSQSMEEIPQLSHGGGIAIINHNTVHHTALSNPSFSPFECIGSVITSSNSLFKFFVVYRMPSLPIANFFAVFESLLELHIASNINLFLLEILNIYIEDLIDYNARHFLKLSNTFGLLQHVTHTI